jgi:hypothetical protein
LYSYTGNESTSFKDELIILFFLFLARSPEELSFEEGEILYVTDDIKYKDWYLATTNKNRTGGLIPKNYGKILFLIFFNFYYFLI